VAYVTAYLKANYPTEYLCAVLHSEEGEVDKVAITVKECKRLGIKISPPNVNYSEDHFTIIRGENGTADTIVFGLNTIKNLGSNAVEEIVKVRHAGGKFKNLSDFIRRIDMKTTNKKSLEALICSGAFDDFGPRSDMLLNIEDILAFQRQTHDTHAGEVSLFGGMEEVADLKLKKVTPLGRQELLKLERELLGLYLSGHPLDPWRDMLKQRTYNITKINRDIKEGTSVDFAGVVTGVKPMLTKKKDKMAFVQVADLEDEIETVVFPKAYELFKDKLVKDLPLRFFGKVNLKNKDQGENGDAQEKKVRDDGSEAKTYGNKAIIIDEIKAI
jgi:DNA polymerase-3 subunit alpha